MKRSRYASSSSKRKLAFCSSVSPFFRPLFACAKKKCGTNFATQGSRIVSLMSGSLPLDITGSS